MSDRPKRLHLDPYGDYLEHLVVGFDEAIRQRGGVPDAHPGLGYEPDEDEVELCRVVLQLIEQRFGADHLRAAIISARIESGDVIDDDLDFSLYLDALDYVKANFGEEAEKELLAEIEKRS